MNKDRCFSGQDSRIRAPNDASRLGWWRTFGRHQGAPCPFCGDVSHAPGCPESEYPITTLGPVAVTTPEGTACIADDGNGNRITWRDNDGSHDPAKCPVCKILEKT